MAKLTPEKAAEAELGFFMKWLNPRKGTKPPVSKQEIATRFHKVSGKRITRQTVERWVRPNAKKRAALFFGTGLVLREVLAQLHTEHLAKLYPVTLAPNGARRRVTRKTKKKGKK